MVTSPRSVFFTDEKIVPQADVKFFGSTIKSLVVSSTKRNLKNFSLRAPKA